MHPTAAATLKGDAFERLNEWNIASVPRHSVAKTRRVRAHKSTKADAPAVPLPLPGASYNPSAEHHVEALKFLAEKRAARAARIGRRERVTPPTAKPAVEEDEEDEDEEEEETEEPARAKQRTEPKTEEELKKERREMERKREARRKLARARRERDEAQTGATIKRALAELREAEARTRERRELREKRVERAEPRVRGKRVEVDDPHAEIVPPSQLPHTMREIPGMARALVGQFQNLHARNVVELGGPRKATFRRKLKLREPRFDLDEHAATRPAAPVRFAPAQWAAAEEGAGKPTGGGRKRAASGKR